MCNVDKPPKPKRQRTKINYKISIAQYMDIVKLQAQDIGLRNLFAENKRHSACLFNERDKKVFPSVL